MLTHLVTASEAGRFMHIPDGYLSPLTALIFFLLVLPFWYRGVKKLRQNVNAQNIPLIALFAAFSFVIMMLNVPLPGGTTGHAVGGAIAAIVLGPEIATIAISMALIIQAFLFGDGGILAIGANCFNMAVVLPYVSYSLFRAISGKENMDSSRRVWAAAIAGYIGLTLAALFTAIEFGVQPTFFHMPDGTPLYAPYPLSVAIPAMMIPHLLVAAVVEAAVTALLFAYMRQTNRSVMESAYAGNQIMPAAPARLRSLWVGLAVLVVATPLGLLAPGTAWGEWGSEELASLGLNFIPAGLAQMEGLWGAPMPDYDIPALGNVTLSYVLSAILGIFIVGIITWLFTRLVSSPAVKPAESSH